MPDARINGVRIWYKETGEGEPVIQIHGAGFGHFNFATATPILSRTFRCIDFDMRGYGQSERPLQNYTMEVWADDVVGLMDHLGLPVAHGTSMGGMVAQQFAAKYPERAQRLVINCSAAKLDYAGVLTFRGWIDIAERFGVGSGPLAELIAMQALSRRFLDGPNGPGAVDMIQDILAKCNRVDIFKRACQAMARRVGLCGIEKHEDQRIDGVGDRRQSRPGPRLCPGAAGRRLHQNLRRGAHDRGRRVRRRCRAGATRHHQDRTGLIRRRTVPRRRYPD
jgi:pimeloyl-ACP methyl ester carboxylesterase